MERCETGEEALVLAAKTGDLKAFDMLALKYRSACVTLARQFLPREAAEDCAQDALISAFRALANLDDPARFKPWLGAIVRHRAYRIGKDRRNAETLPVHELDRIVLRDAPSVTISLPDPADHEVREAVEGLPAGMQEAVRLYYFESWSVGEIAAFTARPVTTVKWQLHAGRELLRRKLNHLEEN